MRAVFQMRGNYELEIHTLMIIMFKRTRKEIANLFNIFDGNLVNANKTVRSKWANLFETSSVDTVQSWKGIRSGSGSQLSPLDRWARRATCPVFFPLSSVIK